MDKRPPPAEAIAPKPVVASLLPEYAIAGGVAARTEMVQRTLFNPTRRPAPAAAQEAAAARLQRGQFALTGTMVVDGKSTAFLREVAGNKARRVQAGEKINGMLVAEVKPDRVQAHAGRRIRGADAQGRHQSAPDRAAGRRRAGGAARRRRAAPLPRRRRPSSPQPPRHAGCRADACRAPPRRAGRRRRPTAARRGAAAARAPPRRARHGAAGRRPSIPAGGRWTRGIGNAPPQRNRGTTQ